MGKVRHRKRVRSARLAASGAPLGADSTEAQAGPSATEPEAKMTSKQRKEGELANLLDKLRSGKVEERIWASAALSGMLLTLPPLTLRSLLAKNLIGLLIERLADPADSVVVESLGALRNLAVSSPPSILAEMHNKRLLLPLASTHLPLLLRTLPARLAPAPAPVKPSLPATPTQRAEADAEQAGLDGRRRLYWDWAENVLSLLWCLAESTTKILGALNADSVAPSLVGFCLALLDARALGLGVGEEDGAKGKKAKAAKGGPERVPTFVALAAAQTLHAFVAGNPSCFKYLLANASLPSLIHILQTAQVPTGHTTSDSHTDAGSDADDWRTIRVLAFGVMLELTKGGKSGSGRDEMRVALKEHAGVLRELIGTDLGQVAHACAEAVPQLDPNPAPMAAPTAPALLLASSERQLSTLQLSLEVLSSWIAANDAANLAHGDDEGDDLDDEDEEWAGADGEGDVEMDGEEDDNDEVIIQKPLPQEEDHGMDEDPSEGEGSEDEDDSEAESAPEAVPAGLAADLPLQLLKLATPSSPLSFAAAPVAPVVSNTSTLVSTTAGQASEAPASPAAAIPSQLSPIAELTTTIHVRALEALNNLFITLALAPKPAKAVRQADLQTVFEGVLGLIQSAIASAGDGAGADAPEGAEVDELQERRMEVVMAGVGAVWGMCRVGLGPKGKLTVGPDATPFLLSVFSHPFAKAQTPAGEAIRVRVAGALGWVARREAVSNDENEAVGQFLLSVLPEGKGGASPLAPTHEVLLQVIDSVIDLYSDEESAWDKAVFRGKGFLQRLQGAVPGVRASHKRIDRKKFPELRSRADGALTNLEAFVEYRKHIV